MTVVPISFNLFTLQCNKLNTTICNSSSLVSYFPGDVIQNKEYAQDSHLFDLVTTRPCDPNINPRSQCLEASVQTTAPVSLTHFCEFGITKY